MDPRHPEIAIDRIDQLINQFKRNLDGLRTATVSSKLAQLERESGLVVQEICLVAPRLHEAMMQVSRTRRAAIAHGLVESHVEKPVENYVEPNQAETVIVEPKPRKKKTSKKKKAE